MASAPLRPSISLPGPWRAVVFDLDGLLVHSEVKWRQAKVILFGRHGTEFHEDDHHAVFGAAELESASYFARRFGRSQTDAESIRDEYMDIVREVMRQPVETTSGAVELIEYLAGRVPIGLASNTRRPLVDELLSTTPFAGRFDAIATADEARPKPAPDVYLLACARLGVDPNVAVALEDSPLGVRAAMAAGMRCIGVPSHPGEPLKEADYRVASLLELLPPGT
jgi:beta-phosphoglucomutase-like phosphatase (HAD superfamily)